MNTTYNALQLALSKLSVLLVSLAFAQATYSVTPTSTGVPILAPSTPLIAQISPKNDPTYVYAYVAQTAAKYGVSVKAAEFIISHESQDCRNMSGDDGISIGCWMFNLKANPQVSRACAEDLVCSTNLAMKWILDGRINAWSTWRFRCKWYKDAPDCD